MGEAAAKALAIDPDLAFAQVLLGSASSFSWGEEIEALEQLLREAPGKTEAVEALGWNLLNVGYLEEAVDNAERYVDRDPLLPAANYWLGNALYAVGRTAEAVAAWERADQLGHRYARSFLGNANLTDGQDDSAVVQIESWAREFGYPDSDWLGELLIGARDPATGEAYLDRRIPQIAASMPAEDAAEFQGYLETFYLNLGYIDRYFDNTIDVALEYSWEDAANHVWYGTIFRRMGFTAHPKYLEIAEANGMVELWEQLGPPDFCSKVHDQWVCE